MQKVTIQNIADETGLSKYAVSRALSGKSGVSETTRTMVENAARRLGYVPKRKQDRPTIAMLCEDADLINGELNAAILAGARDEAHHSDVELVEIQTTGARRLSDVIERADALVFVGVSRKTYLAEARQSKLPMVKIGTFEPLERADIVRGTNYETGQQVGELLLQAGHRRLVFVRGERDFRGRQERFNGFFAACHNRQDACVTDLRWSQPEELGRKLDELLGAHNPATGFFCAHDGLAVTIVSELLARNIRIPDEASVIGYGDYLTAQHVRPALTTVRVPGRGFGREAIKLVLRRLSEGRKDPFPLRVQIPSEIVLRQSHGVARGHITSVSIQK